LPKKESFKESSGAYGRGYKKLLPEKKNVKILDVGFGMGHFIYFLKQERVLSTERLGTNQKIVSQRYSLLSYFMTLFKQDPVAAYLKIKEELIIEKQNSKKTGELAYLLLLEKIAIL
jgi:hypothetical protein